MVAQLERRHRYGQGGPLVLTVLYIMLAITSYL